MFSLTVTWTEDNQLKFFKVIDSETLVEVAAKFGLVVAELAEQVKREAVRVERQIPDDDIPF